MTSSSSDAKVARCAVIAGHGEFAAGLISAVQEISGRGDAFRAVTNRDLSAAALDELLRSTISASAARLIFTDLPAGSCTIAARRIARDLPGIVVVTGANLSVLLSWAFGADDDAAACERALARGRRAMAVLSGAVTAEGGGAH